MGVPDRPGVTAAPAHRKRVQVEGWREATAVELPEEGVDVLINPRSLASMRLLTAALRRAVA